MQNRDIENNGPSKLFYNADEPRCPISYAIFFRPVAAQCGHVFEKECIEKCKTCPNCRQEIKSLSPLSPIQDEALKKRPELIADMYYSDSLLDSVLINNDPTEMNRLTKLLCSQTHVLNKISEDKSEIKHGNYTTLYWLCSKKNGEIILNNPELRKKVESKALNYRNTQGKCKEQSALTWLALPNSQHLLIKDADLRGKIEEKALNHIITIEGEDKDRSVVYDLASTSEGRKMLLEDSVLRSKISRTALNHVISTNDECKGQSVATLLAKLPDGRKLLLKPELRNKISPVLLQEIISKENALKGIFNSQTNIPIASYKTENSLSCGMR